MCIYTHTYGICLECQTLVLTFEVLKACVYHMLLVDIGSTNAGSCDTEFVFSH